MSKETPSGQQMAEQPKEEPNLTAAQKVLRQSVRGAGGSADLGYISESGDPKFQRPRRDIASL